MTTHDPRPDPTLTDPRITALAAPDASVRLRAALAVGSDPGPGSGVETARALVARCAAEPDFYVRDMLTWALCRLPPNTTVPLLVHELGARRAQARSQALHTLSKIGDASAFPAVTALLHDRDDDAARSAWRAAVALVAPEQHGWLAAELADELGRGDRETAAGLARALVALGEPVLPVVEHAATRRDPRVRAHAEATLQLYRDPDSGFALSEHWARRAAALGPGRDDGR
ncbi:HEAT repeat domain-containing protein [Rhodococcus rhodnii]|uniref:HEAT repeat domain-containing protein n=1 Tax=Rhodococcus rhodnii TaxID=38312 RepID=A0A6P2CIQ9_9NOCA|nr:HEAT repeat domain-containing protein [Rhodococcus rhodnii]TXG92717.1 HEAT repeat domain-containing protein [Rhodococcus rhodnii]